MQPQLGAVEGTLGGGRCVEVLAEDHQELSEVGTLRVLHVGEGLAEAFADGLDPLPVLGAQELQPDWAQDLGFEI